MENIAERIKKVRKGLNLSQQEFAESLELSQGVISSIENGRRNVSRNVLESLGLKHRINATWVLTGEGEMFLPRQISAFKEAEQTINNVKEALIKTADISDSTHKKNDAKSETANFEAKRRANTIAAIAMLENVVKSLEATAQSIESAIQLLKENTGE